MTASGNIESIYQLSPAQAGILFHAVDAPESGVYVQQVACRLQGELNEAAFRQAWEAAIARHAALRTLFTWEKRDKPLQLVRERAEAEWAALDWRALDQAEREREAEAYLRRDRQRGFDLGRAPLARFGLARLSEDEHLFVWTFHHLITDGWSTSLILREAFADYHALCSGPAPERPRPRPYQDYIRWHQQQAQAASEQFWREALRGFEAPTRLEAGAPDVSGAGYEQRLWRLSPETTAGLQALAQASRVTLNTVLQGAWALLLSRYSGSDDVVFGVTVSGRPAALEGVDSMVGMFINTLPLRAPVPVEAEVGGWLRDLQARNLALREHEHSSLASVQAWSGVARGQSLFDTLLVYENYPAGEALAPEGLNVRIADLQYFEQSNYPLALLAVPGPQMQLYLIFDRSVHAPEAVERLQAHLTTLLGGLATGAGRRLGELEMLPEDELRLVTETWNQTRLDYPRQQCIHHYVEQQAARAPDAPAVITPKGELTYAELNARADRLAAHLNSLGVGVGDRVGLCVERSADMVVGMLGGLKAGAAYVPLDPTYPRDRLADMLEAAQARAVVSHRGLADGLPLAGLAPVELDAEWLATEQAAPEGERPAITADSLAYLIFTSGSTGQPKGVPVSHANLVHSTTARFHYYPEPAARFLLLSSFAFDSSVAGIYWALCQGGALCLPEPGGEKDVQRILALVQQWRVTHTLCLPSLYSLLLEFAQPGQLESLRTVIVAGEACGPALVQRHYQQLPSAALYNEYGPTEGTVWVTAHRLSRDDERAAPIGQPIPNMRCYVLDAQRRPVPVGVPGELYIGGDGLAAGYWQRSDLTETSFVEIDSPPIRSRLYRTGDLVRWRADGLLEFLGRVDHQVKVRGYRIELEEIEAVLGQHPAVREAAVVARAEAPFAIDADDVDALAARLAALGAGRAARLLDEVEQMAAASR